MDKSQGLNEARAHLLEAISLWEQIKTTAGQERQKASEMINESIVTIECLKIQLKAIEAFQSGTNLSPAAFEVGQEVICTMYKRQYAGTVTDRAYDPYPDKWLYRAALTGDRIPSNHKAIVAAEYFPEHGFKAA